MTLRQRNDSTNSLGSEKGQKFHDKKVLLRLAKEAMKRIKYDNTNIGTTMFDENELDGWNFLSERIFELPRNAKFVKVLNHRLAEADNIHKMLLKEESRKNKLKNRSSFKIAATVMTMEKKIS
tara:strand:+ start:522 stop:890 length:369 start_codon:yes stop_codon:yes gene_type:complete